MHPAQLQLQIDYIHHPEVITADPREVYYLDRQFVSNGEDTSISRWPNSPCLRYRAGTWWIDNDSHTTKAELRIRVRPEQQKYDIMRRCSFALPDGQTEVYFWHVNKYPMAVLTLNGSEPQRVRPTPPPPGRAAFDRDAAVTQPGRPDAEQRVRALFAEDHMLAVQLAAYYREYYISSPHKAAPLSRLVVGKCFGRAPYMIDDALKKIQRAIWGDAGHTDDIPDFLFSRSLLPLELRYEIPHWDCGHQREVRVP